MTQKQIGPSFASELAAAGLVGLPFSWGADGSINFSPTMTAQQIAAVQAVYAAHNPATIEPSQQARNALAVGLQIVSTGTSALNGTYAVDAVSQADIIAIETSINAGKGFPGGSATFDYPDVAGSMHSFSEANFTNFAAAVRDFVYACRSVIAGQSAAVPNGFATIA